MWELLGGLLAVAVMVWLVQKFFASRPEKPRTGTGDEGQNAKPAEKEKTPETAEAVQARSPIPQASVDPAKGSTKWLSPAESAIELTRDEDGKLTFTIERREGEIRFVGIDSGKQAAPGNMQLARLGIFYFNVRGHKHYPEVRIKTGTRVKLQREPDNIYDKNAIAITRFRNRSVYGYINKGFASRLAKKIDSGQEHFAIVTGRGGITVAVMPTPIAAELGLTGDTSD